jgi:hypothetical protein
MKNTKTKKPLPKLAVRTLDYHELGRVTGGLPPRGDPTGSTLSVCAEDGVTDGDTF